MATYLDCKSYWALVTETEPRLRPVEVGELTAYLNGTGKRLRESLRFAAKIIAAELDGLRVAEAKKVEAEEERREKWRENSRKRRAARIVSGVSQTDETHGDIDLGEIERKKEELPPTPPKEEKREDKETVCVQDITLFSKPSAQACEGAQEREGEDRPVATKRFTPPTVEEVRAYVAEKGYHIDAEAFVAFYSSKGWKVGQTPMKDWRMACVTWQKRRLADCTDAPETTMEAERLAALSAPVPHYDMH